MRFRRSYLFRTVFIFCLALDSFWCARGENPPAEIRIVQIQGTVEVMPAGANRWILTQTNQTLRAGDRLRTAEKSRAAVQWSDQSVVSFGSATDVEILPPDKSDSLAGLQVWKGLMSFFHRDKPGRIRVLSRGATAGISGTEFVMEVFERNGSERVVISVTDGEVQLGNSDGTVRLSNGEQGVAETGRAPIRTAGFVANNVMQWCFYYPGVLDLADLHLSDTESDSLKESLQAYRQGDLLSALAKYPPGRESKSDSERVYHAALLLSVGEVAQSETELSNISRDGQPARLAVALRTLVAAVKRAPNSSTLDPELSTELLAASYYEQSFANSDDSLSRALDFARRATKLSPEFGFAGERLAELEFSFGRVAQSEVALQHALELSPRNAQALALKGFLLAAKNQRREAIEWFDRAIAIDSALGNAWLGRGLCRIRGGDLRGGRDDLLIATALEPQRSVLRSYLGKAWFDSGDFPHATKELKLAQELDKNDPTSWLYSALLLQQQNRINEAIRDLEHSQKLNDNRSLFRSRMLLDQDRAVRGANLASMYRDAGMSDVGLREAARAVSYDYANDSAHLFLSDSYNELRDPTRFNLRHETVWFNELLLANLLAPVGAGRLSQTVSQQEYSKLFESDGLGIAGQTTWRSDNQFRQLASQLGTFRNSSWAFDLDYQHNDGVRPNNDLNRIEWYTTLKQQLTPADTLLVLVKYEDYDSGDNFQYYDPATSSRPNFRFEEHQEPILIGGYQHEWSPGARTLLLGGRLVNEQSFSDLQSPQLLLIEDGLGAVAATDAQPHDVRLRDELEIYTAELNHILQRERFTLLLGARWQGGDFNFANTLSNSPLPEFFLPSLASQFSEQFECIGGYGYLTVEPIERLWLTAGLDSEWMKYPENFRNPPQSAGTETRHQVGPKFAVVWNPLLQATLRGIFGRSLGGVSLEESYRLEPTQLAGFPQTFRTVISESIVGSVEAPETYTAGLALDLKFGYSTFGGIQFSHLSSEVRRQIGVFRLDDGLAPFAPSTTPERLEYEENTLAITMNQLLGQGFASGLNYRLTHAELETALPEISPSVSPVAARDESAWLHEIGGYVLFNHSSGFFARFDANYFVQSNHGYSPALPGDDLIRLDLQIGWRFCRRRAELSVGVLNLTGEDYRLNALTLYSEMPRERVFFTRCSFRF